MLSVWTKYDFSIHLPYLDKGQYITEIKPTNIIFCKNSVILEYKYTFNGILKGLLSYLHKFIYRKRIT